jgi:hypothetical protein
MKGYCDQMSHYYPRVFGCQLPYPPSILLLAQELSPKSSPFKNRPKSSRKKPQSRHGSAVHLHVCQMQEPTCA